MAGLNVVLTGLFPEVGGGSGLNLGKDKVKKMVEAFGGKVTGAVSGRTHILVVGKDPGLGKYSQAQSQPNCQIMVRCMHKAFSCITIVTHSAPVARLNGFHFLVKFRSRRQFFCC